MLRITLTTFAIVILVPLLVRTIFVRWQRYSPAARERAAFKKNLAPWVKLIEFLLFVIFWMAAAGALFYFFDGLYSFFHPRAAAESAKLSLGLIAFSSLIAALAPSMLLVNFVSAHTPSMTQANEDAMRGLPAASFQSANRGLIMVGAFLVPAALAAGLLGALAPWMQ
jgi:hypothetical protein